MRTSCTYAIIYKCLKRKFHQVPLAIAIFTDGRVGQVWYLGSMDNYAPTGATVAFAYRTIFVFAKARDLGAGCENV